MDPESSNGKLTYEEVRLKRIEENKKRLKELGVLEKASVFKKRYSKVTTPRKIVKSTFNPGSIVGIRRSPRVARKSPINYKEPRGIPPRGEAPPRRSSRRLALKRRFISSAGEIETEHPSFVKRMLKSHVSNGFWLGLPHAFCNAHFSKDKLVILEDEEGLEWEAVYLQHKTGLSGGWRGFSIDHDLEDGDTLVFELVKPTRFKVYIIRAANSEKHDPDHKFVTSKKYVYALKENKENEHVNSPLHKILKREQLEREEIVSPKQAKTAKPSRKRKLDLSGPQTTDKSRKLQDIKVESAFAEVSNSKKEHPREVVGSPDCRWANAGRILRSQTGRHTMYQSREQQGITVESEIAEVSNPAEEHPLEGVGSPESRQANSGRILRSRGSLTMDQSRDKQDAQVESAFAEVSNSPDGYPREVVESPESRQAKVGRILRSQRLRHMDQSREQQHTQVESTFGEVSDSEDGYPRQVVGSPESRQANSGHRILRSRGRANEVVAKSVSSMESRTPSSVTEGVVKSATSMESRTRSSGSEQCTQNKCSKKVVRLSIDGKPKPVAFCRIANNGNPRMMPPVNIPPGGMMPPPPVTTPRMLPMNTVELFPRSKPKLVAFCRIANNGKSRMMPPVNTTELPPRTKPKPIAFCSIANNGKPKMPPPDYVMTLPGSCWKPPLPERRLVCEGAAPPEYMTTNSGSSVKPSSTFSDSSVKPSFTRRAKS